MNDPFSAKILITGAGGLVGQTVFSFLKNKNFTNLLPLSHKQLDITQNERVQEVFRSFKPEYVINCAAYTAVDKAEKEKTACYQINVNGTANLARAAAHAGSVFVHLSSDYVFDGKKREPYTEEDPANPLNYYGYTKWLSEEEVRKAGGKHYIIRPAWIYGRFGNNFFHRVLQWAKEKDVLYAAADQTGSPTNAEDLAEFIYFLIRHDKPYGLYHFSNEGEATRYDMVREILRLTGIEKEVIPVPSSYFKPLARRPAYSVLSKEKIKKLWNYPVPDWRESMRIFVKRFGYDTQN